MIKDLKIMTEEKFQKVAEYDKLLNEIYKNRDSMVLKNIKTTFERKNLKNHSKMINDYLELNKIERDDKLFQLKKNFKKNRFHLKDNLIELAQTENLIENNKMKIIEQEFEIQNLKDQYFKKQQQKEQVYYKI